MNGLEVNPNHQSFPMRTLPLGDVAVFLIGLTAFLPYIKTSPSGSDVQPHYYALLPFVIFLFLRFNSAKILYGGYCLLLLAFGVYLKMSSVELIAFAGTFSAVGVLAGMNERQRNIMFWAVRIALVLYLLAACVEVIGGGGLLDKVVANRRRSVSRGLCAFASEPSFLGFVGLAGFVVLRKSTNSSLRMLDSVLPFLVIFCSGSIAAIIPAVVVALMGSLKSVQAVVVSVVSLLSLLLIAFVFFPNSRFVELNKQFRESPAEILEESSGANRIFRGVGPTYYGFKTGLMPHSPSELDQIYRKMKFLRDDVRITRISNLGGVMFFVFGIFSLPLIGAYAAQFRGLRVEELAFTIAVVVVFSFSLITASTPYLHVVLGSLLWRSQSPIASSSFTDPLTN